MQYAGKRAEKWILRIMAVMLCLTLISLRMVCGLYARFSARDAKADGAGTAAFVFRVGEEDCFVDISKITKPGDRETYTFTVSNETGNAVSEVSEEYEMKIELRGSLPLVCSLTDEDDKSLVLMDADNLTEDKDVLSGSADTVSFRASVKEKHTYTLTVAWPEEENDAVYANAGLSDVVLGITAGQTD